MNKIKDFFSKAKSIGRSVWEKIRNWTNTAWKDTQRFFGKLGNKVLLAGRTINERVINLTKRERTMAVSAAAVVMVVAIVLLAVTTGVFAGVPTTDIALSVSDVSGDVIENALYVTGTDDEAVVEMVASAEPIIETEPPTEPVTEPTVPEQTQPPQTTTTTKATTTTTKATQAPTPAPTTAAPTPAPTTAAPTPQAGFANAWGSVGEMQSDLAGAAAGMGLAWDSSCGNCGSPLYSNGVSSPSALRSKIVGDMSWVKNSEGATAVYVKFVADGNRYLIYVYYG